MMKPVALTDRPAVFLMTDSFDTGGSEQQFATLAKALDQSLFRLHVGCIANRGGFNSGLEEIAEFPLGGNLYGFKSIDARMRLARHLRSLQVAVAHAFDFYTNLTLIPAARLAGTAVVIGSQRQLGDLLSPARERAQRMMLKWCDSVVCNSRAAADRLVRYGIPEQQIAVIHNGLPLSAFAACSPALPVHSARLRIGMIARMNTYSKNHKLFLRAVGRLCGKFSNLEVVLAGDGPLRAEFERDAEALGIREKVQFLGNRKDIPAILASLDVSVLPSASESQSNVIIESMAAGVPVVASNVGGNPELVSGSTGILVPPGEELALATAVEQLLSNPAMRAWLGRNAHKFALENFTIAEMQRQHQELYTELLAKKRGAPATQRCSTVREKRRLRIAIIAASSRYVGGQSVQAELLLKNWQKDPDIDAYFIPIDPGFPRGLKWAEKIPIVRTIIRQPIYWRSLWRGIKKADITHIFSASYWSFFLAPVPAWGIARLQGKKAIIHYHSGEARDHLTRSRSAKFILRRTDELVVPSQYLRGVFREFNLQAQAIPNVVDLSQFRFRAREPIRPHLVCTRGFHPYYQVDQVVHAFAVVKQEYPGARLDLVGGGQEEKKIRELVNELGLANVHFSGVAPHHEIAQSYDQADIFINASILDNMPVSILEAFASGTPVVSTAPEGIKYLVEHECTGLLSEPGDATALGLNVIRLLQDRGLALRIAQNAQIECTRYSWAQVQGQWLATYRALELPEYTKAAPSPVPQTKLEEMQ